MTPGEEWTDSLIGDVASEVASAAAPFSGPVVKRLLGVVGRELRRARSTALTAASDAAQMSWADLTEALDEDPELVPLYIRLLHAAGTTGYDKVLTALGTAFGDAVRDRGSIDECAMILASLEGLTKAHIQILRVVAVPSPEQLQQWQELAGKAATGDISNASVTEVGAPELAAEEEREQENRPRWFPSMVADATGSKPHLVRLCLSALVSRGLVTNQAAWGGLVYGASDLGQTVLEVIDHHSERGRTY